MASEIINDCFNPTIVMMRQTYQKKDCLGIGSQQFTRCEDESIAPRPPRAAGSVVTITLGPSKTWRQLSRLS